jgi:hypothetical protein
MGRPEWRPERGITDRAVEAQAQAMISQPRRVSCREGSAPRDAAGCRPASYGTLSLTCAPEQRFRVWQTSRRAR